MISFDAAHAAVHYPPDRRFRIWIRPSLLVAVAVMMALPVLLAWAQLLTFGNNVHNRFGHVEVLLEDLRLTRLLHHFPAQLVWSVYVGINGFMTIALLALLALVTGSPFVFPSLGPTAYLFFFTPMAEASSPRNTILGHAIGLVCGYAAFMLTVFSGHPATVHDGVHGPTVLATALLLSLTGAPMVLFKVSHLPAGATTLIVSLGLIAQPKTWSSSNQP